MPDTFVIKVLYGGLGDHLFYSHLPRIAKEAGGFKRVLISNLSEYRNPDYRRLVWEANPYVDGFCDNDAPSPDAFTTPKNINILDHLMLLRGLDDGLRFHEPILYFKPSIIESLREAVVYDPNYISNIGQVESRHVEAFFAREKIRPDYMLTVRPKGLGVQDYGSILTTKDLEHYCSVIVSAKTFICLTSGGATLAAALGKPVIALWGDGQHSMFHHSRLHRYVNVNPQPLPLRYLRGVIWRYRLAMQKLSGRGKKSAAK